MRCSSLGTTKPVNGEAQGAISFSVAMAAGIQERLQSLTCVVYCAFWNATAKESPRLKPEAQRGQDAKDTQKTIKLHQGIA